MIEHQPGDPRIPLAGFDEARLFLGKLAAVTDAQGKRDTIRVTFIYLFEEVSYLGPIEFHTQGTHNPDVINEPGRGPLGHDQTSNLVICGLPERRKLYAGRAVAASCLRNVVPALGREPGPPEVLVEPILFPAPVWQSAPPGEVTRAKLDILRKAAEGFLEEIHTAGILRGDLAGFCGAAADGEC